VLIQTVQIGLMAFWNDENMAWIQRPVIHERQYRLIFEHLVSRYQASNNMAKNACVFHHFPQARVVMTSQGNLRVWITQQPLSPTPGQRIVSLIPAKTLAA
jgi:hypothetical protein